MLYAIGRAAMKNDLRYDILNANLSRAKAISHATPGPALDGALIAGMPMLNAECL